MKEYQSLEKDQKELFDKLANAIKENANASDNAQGILTSTNSQDVQKVLGTWLVGHCGKLEGLFTFLTYAIGFGKIEIAQAILENASDDVLTELLSVESIIQRADGTKKFTALSFAEKEGYTDLAKKVSEKMGELRLLTLVEESLDEDDESLGSTMEGCTNSTEEFTRRMKESLREDDESLGSTMEGCTNSTEEFTRRMKESLREDDGSLGSTRGGYTDLMVEFMVEFKENIETRAKIQIELSSLASNNLPWEVFFRDGKAANGTLKSLRNLDSKFIGEEMAQELAEKENKEIIKEIQTRQAVTIAIIGFVIVVLAAAAIATIIFTAPVPMTTLTITGIVIAGVIEVVGVAGVGFAGYHRFTEIPYTQVEEVGANNPAQLLRK